MPYRNHHCPIVDHEVLLAPWDDSYRCPGCGAILDPETLEVLYERTSDYESEREDA